MASSDTDVHLVIGKSAAFDLDCDCPMDQLTFRPEMTNCPSRYLLFNEHICQFDFERNQVPAIAGEPPYASLQLIIGCLQNTSPRGM